MSGGNEGIGIEETAPGGVVITALEIIEACFLVMLVAGELFFDLWDTPIQLQIIPDVGRRNGLLFSDELGMSMRVLGKGCSLWATSRGVVMPAEVAK